MEFGFSHALFSLLSKTGVLRPPRPSVWIAGQGTVDCMSVRNSVSSLLLTLHAKVTIAPVVPENLLFHCAERSSHLRSVLLPVCSASSCNQPPSFSKPFSLQALCLQCLIPSIMKNSSLNGKSPCSQSTCLFFPL